jgi:hypothetical protein
MSLKATNIITGHDRQKQLANLQYFKYLFSIVTNNLTCAREIISGIATAKLNSKVNNFSTSNLT